MTSGDLDRGTVSVHYEVYGEGDPTVFLLMPDTIVNSRAWKGQIPFLARSFRVVVVDPRGNGLSGRPRSPADMALDAMIGDAWAILDEVGAEQAVLVGLCTGGAQAVAMAAERPERVLGVVGVNPWLVLAPPLPHRLAFDFDAVLDTDEGWAKQNRHYWERDWPGFAEFFFNEMFPEPHSSKQVEDCVAWAMQTTVEAMLLEVAAAETDRRVVAAAHEEICRQVRCPVLVVTGSLDNCQNPERSYALAELTGAEHVVIDGGGHLPNARDPVKVNLLIRDFVRRVAGQPR